jgi:hypothetical protein
MDIFKFSQMLEVQEYIDIQNNKSKLIIDEYERNAEEKMKYIDEEKQKIKSELLLLKEKEETLNDSDYENEIENIKCISLNLLKKYNKLDNINKYPHGNGIYGFALEYLDASNRINIEWKEYIWTNTILGYKKVYPQNAHDYIQYTNDIKTSNDIMKQIYTKLQSNKKDIYEIYFCEWCNIIKSFLEENNINIDENTVFRPYIHRDMKQDDDVFDYRITKSDLSDELTDDDYDILFDILNNGFENTLESI